MEHGDADLAHTAAREACEENSIQQQQYDVRPPFITHSIVHHYSLFCTILHHYSLLFTIIHHYYFSSFVVSQILGQLSDICYKASFVVRPTVAYFKGELNISEFIPSASGTNNLILMLCCPVEVESIFSVPISFFLDQSNWRTLWTYYSKIDEEQSGLTPIPVFFMCNLEPLLWGVTAHIIYELVELLLGRPLFSFHSSFKPDCTLKYLKEIVPHHALFLDFDGVLLY